MEEMGTEKTELAEAERTEITTVAVCDTNVNPEQVNYAIPANDDAVNSIKLIVDLVAEAVNEGRKEFEKKKLERAKEEPVKHDAVKIERGALKKEESV